MIPRAARQAADLLVTVLAVAWLRVPHTVVVSFADVPAEVTTIAIAEVGHDGNPGAMSREPITRPVTFSYSAGTSVVVFFVRADGAYVIDGPFTWPEEVGVRTLGALGTTWRRTVESQPFAGGGGSPLDWISEDPSPAPWPRCAWARHDRWTCWGVPVGVAGVVASQSDGVTSWSIVTPTGRMASQDHRSQWGRLLRVRSAGSGDLPPLEIALHHLVAAPAHRLRGVRLEIADLHASVTPLSRDAAWLAGDDSPPGAWLDISAGDLGPLVVPLADVLSGAPTIAYVVGLSPPQEIHGVVVDPADRPVAAALVSLFRLVDPPDTLESRARGEPRARRVAAGQLVTATDGQFAFDRLPAGDFEVLAWHAQLGRLSTYVRAPAPRAMTIRLTPAASVRGRVVMEGNPIGDVPVVSVPDVSAVSAADDLTELKGGDTRTGPDGRFDVALADKGGGELRVGGAATAIRRIPLPAGPQHGTLDLGDIELQGPLAVTFVLDQNPECDLVAVGPIGHAGLQIVTAHRTQPGMFAAGLPEAGDWRIALSCGGAERAVVPGLVNVTPGVRTINLRVQ